MVDTALIATSKYSLIHCLTPFELNLGYFRITIRRVSKVLFVINEQSKCLTTHVRLDRFGHSSRWHDADLHTIQPALAPHQLI